MNGRKATFAAAVTGAAALVVVPTWTGAAPKPVPKKKGAVAHNVIVLQGDGMATAQRDLIRLVTAGNKPGKDLVMNQLDHTGLVHTDPADPKQAVTDSAAAATAFSTGHKSFNGAIGVDTKGRALRTLLEDARKMGKATGLVTTSQVTDATPAAYAAHVSDRGEQSEIARQYLVRTKPDLAELKIATWNLEWFMKPETLRALTPACTPRDAPRDGARRAIPCDVAHELARSGEDIAALRRYARILDADVVALQEVDGPDAARLVFTDHEFCFSGRVAVQNNGFAIRRGLPFSCGPDLESLSLNGDVRRGVELRLFPGSPTELRLLSVHLKSGCARDELSAAKSQLLGARQPDSGPGAMDRRSRPANKSPSRCWAISIGTCAVNRLAASLWGQIDDLDPPDADLVNTAEGQTFQNCMPQQTFSGYIDYIVLGRRMARGLVENSFGRELYRPRDAQRRKLSDHCPVFIRLRVADATSGSS